MRIGLVLGGGGTRGLAHIGVLSVLENLGVHIDAIVGCSIGAIIGAMVASKKSASEIEHFVGEKGLKDFLNLSITTAGIRKTTRLEKNIFSCIKRTTFEQLEKPLYINATNLTKNCQTVFSKGDLFVAIRASIAIPGIFSPVMIGNDLHVDGAVWDIAPHAIMPKMDRYIIVNVSPYVAPEGHVSAIKVLQYSDRLMKNEMLHLRLQSLDKKKYVLIEPKVGKHQVLEPKKNFYWLIEEGKRTAQLQAAAIKKLVR